MRCVRGARTGSRSPRDGVRACASRRGLTFSGTGKKCAPIRQAIANAVSGIVQRLRGGALESRQRRADPSWLARWLDEQIRFDARWEQRVIGMILANLSLLFGETFASVQQLNRFRKSLPRPGSKARA
jgi:hypothetical protein